MSSAGMCLYLLRSPVFKVKCDGIYLRSYYSTVMNVFDRKAKCEQRERMLLDPDYKTYQYVKEEIGFRVFDRLCDVKRTFPVSLDLGCGLGHVSKHITLEQQLVTEKIYMTDHSTKILELVEKSRDVPTELLHVDEEYLSNDCPIADDSLDLVYSSLSLHWVNDLPGLFRNVLKLLKKDSVFIGSLFGTDTLYELRVSLQLAEQELLGGFYPHISPFTAVRDMGDLLDKAGYKLVTLDSDEIVINYPGIWELMKDIRGMGESSCSWSRPLSLRRDVIRRAEQIYRERYGNTDGSIPASFCILSFIGWKPDPSQPKAAQRGSAEVSIKDISTFIENQGKATPEKS